MARKSDHKFDGCDEFCSRCHRLSSFHRIVRNRRAYYSAREREPLPPVSDYVIGLDGEGIGRKPHRYVYMAAADQNGRTWSMEPTGGLMVKQRITTVQFLDFILSLPDRALLVFFAGLYDLSKGLEDLPDAALYLLFREKLRARKIEGQIIYRPITWNGYRINFMNRRFSVQKGKRRRTVWDIFRFFQTKFTNALIDWQVAEKSKLERMAEMKDQRSQLETLWRTPDGREKVKAYCKEECLYLAKLGRQLIDAHTNAGIKLKSYFGAGSTASALLKSWGVGSKRGEIPDAMREPVARSFFGGRFENSVVGPVERHVYEYDISSAYPYQATLLPCLLHGHWRHVRNRGRDRAIAGSALALVRWFAPKPYGSAWGPLPVRSRDGTIGFPLGAKGGWSWKDEFLAARKINPTLEVEEAWTYETDCDCGSPFADLPRIYNERLALGSDTRGYPLKLGSNSVYGKTVQTAGFNPPFRNFVWGANITSGCRAQLLGAIANVKDPWDILALATDGIQSLVPLTLPTPADTGTSKTGKPLGGWTTKDYPGGVFYVRPGIYFPLNATDEQIKIVRARGIGKRVLYDQRERILEAWEAKQDHVEFQSVSRFVGAKSGITLGKDGFKRSPDCGDWVEHPIVVSFNPLPKRVERMPNNRLRPHTFFDWMSEPYNPAMVSPEMVELLISESITEEQPNLDFETEAV